MDKLEKKSNKTSPVPPSRSRSRRFFAIALLLFLVAVMAALFHKPLLHGVARWLIVGRQPAAGEQYDAIIALGGKDFRKRYLLEIYQQKFAPEVVLIFNEFEEYGIPFNNAGRIPEVALDHLVNNIGMNPANITIIRNQTSTYDEAVTLKHLLAEKKWQKVIIIDSAFHTRRSRWIFRKVLGELSNRITFVPVPFVNPTIGIDPESVIVAGVGLPGARETMGVEEWWSREEDMVTIFEEYVKFVFYLWNYHWFHQLSNNRKRLRRHWNKLSLKKNANEILPECQYVFIISFCIKE